LIGGKGVEKSRKSFNQENQGSMWRIRRCILYNSGGKQQYKETNLDIDADEFSVRFWHFEPPFYRLTVGLW
jgi:hypothetical protein